MQMPGMNGPAVFERIRDYKSDAKVIVCSGQSDQETARRMLSQGALAYINKPFRVDDLLAKISQAINS